MSKELSDTPTQSISDLAKLNRNSQSGTSGGFLSFNGKTGAWAFGSDEEPVDGAQCLILAKAIQHGYMRWGERPPVKIFSLDWQPYPPRPESKEGTDYDGRPTTFNAVEARQFIGKFVGEEENLGQFTFNTSSMGGVENVDKLYDAIYLQDQNNPDFTCPLVELDRESYKRDTGKVYKPVFKVVKWCDVNGTPETLQKKLEEVADEVEAEAEAEEEIKPRRRRRSA